jgi:hypothetical protein
MGNVHPHMDIAADCAYKYWRRLARHPMESTNDE